MSIKSFVPRLFILSLAASLVATAVATAAPALAQGATDDNAPITVWIDQPRQPMIDAYLKANPDKAKLIKAVVVDREQFPAKVLLFNNTQQGWPDVVFAEPRFATIVSDFAHQFPLDLKPLVPADTLAKYDGMSGCTFGDKVYCLRNDLAQYVLYYNKPLMDKFGYTVPTTWEDYQALSDKVAKDHPGYLLGTFGGGWQFLAYFDAGSCPSHLLTDDNTLKIDMTDPNCVRVAKMLDHMIANKTLWNADYFDPSFVKEVQDNNHLLMIPMASWAWGVFGGNKDGWYKTADHQLGVAAPLKWKAEDKAVDVAQGGAAWMVSQHTKNPKLAVDLITYLTTSPDIWGSIENFPAYEPIQPLFGKQVSSNALFANDPFPIMQAAAPLFGPLDKFPRFDLISPLTEFVKTVYSDKSTVEAELSKVNDKLQPLAESVGYQVVNK